MCACLDDSYLSINCQSRLYYVSHFRIIELERTYIDNFDVFTGVFYKASCLYLTMLYSGLVDHTVNSTSPPGLAYDCSFLLEFLKLLLTLSNILQQDKFIDFGSNTSEGEEVEYVHQVALV